MYNGLRIQLNTRKHDKVEIYPSVNLEREDSKVEGKSAVSMT